MILVPLSSVLYVLALASFATAGYYGFRLTRLARKTRLMLMIGQDGPQFILGGIVILAISQVMNLIDSLSASLPGLWGIVSDMLLMSSSLMFAKGFHSMYVIYRNERLRNNVYASLDGLDETEKKLAKEEWRKELR
jgi:hypothetical protein